MPEEAVTKIRHSLGMMHLQFGQPDLSEDKGSLSLPLTATGNINVDTSVTLLNTGGSAATYTLPNGTRSGQLKIIIALGVSNTTTVAITTSVGAAANVIFQTVGESITCMWTGAAWAILSYGSGATGTNVVGGQDVT